MKRLIFSMGILTLLSFAVSCSDDKKEEKENHEHHTMYQCPMKCEGDKMYDKAGKCPTCNMDLKEVESENHDEGHAH